MRPVKPPHAVPVQGDGADVATLGGMALGIAVELELAHEVSSTLSAKAPRFEDPRVRREPAAGEVLKVQLRVHLAVERLGCPDVQWSL